MKVFFLLLILQIYSGYSFHVASTGRHVSSLALSREDRAEISRRTALISAAALSLGVSQAEAVNLERFARQLEMVNMLKKNSDGAPEKHLPKVSIDEKKRVSVSVPHIMDPDKPHFILMIWLHEVKSNDIAVVKGFPADSPSPPTLTLQVPANIELKPMLYCNLHGLWEGDSFRVTDKGELIFT